MEHPISHSIVICVTFLQKSTSHCINSLKLFLKHQIGTDSLHLHTWCAIVNRFYTCHVCARGILDFSFNYAVIDKNKFFMKLPQIWRTHKNCIFYNIFLKQIDRPFCPVDFVSGTYLISRHQTSSIKFC